MPYTARRFLGTGVRDPIAAPSEAALAALPEPAYVAELRRALLARGIAFLDLGYDIARTTTGEGHEFRRTYRVRSFLWDDAMWVTRISFADRHFAAWPDALQAIWRETTVDVPDTPAGRARQ